MNEADRYHRLRALFDSSIGLVGVERERFIDRECGPDADLRRELQLLLQAAEPVPNSTDAFSDQRIDQVRGRFEADAKRIGELQHSDKKKVHGQHLTNEPTRIAGRYQIVRRVASGGMGSVYEATQDSPQRRVALKMVHVGRLNATLIERMHRESEVLGRLQHPGIAQIYDAGSADLGDGPQPYLALEFIDGISLTKHCDHHQLDHAARLDLLASICDAVQYAHDKGVIHRDLKPDNILIDHHGTPKILDFGIARVTTDSSLHAATMTQAGQLLGTVAYMAPEQMDADSTVSARSDVYALGVVGFELLARRLPYQLAGLSPAVALRRVLDHDPPLLSEINPELRGDLATIIDKALQRVPQRRYESAAALAEDLRRYLKREPIAARPTSLTYRALRFTQRHRGLVVATVMVFATLLIGIVVSTRYAFQAESARRDTGKALAQLSETVEQLNNTVAELEDVASYQESQLAQMDLSLLAEGFRSALIEEKRQALAHAGHSSDEIESKLNELEVTLDGVLFPTIARSTLEAGIFEQSLKTIDRDFADQPLVRAKLLLALGKVMLRVGDIFKGRSAIREAVQLRRSELGDDHLETLRAIAVASKSLQGETKSDTFELAREAYFGLRNALGNTDPETLAAHLTYSSQAQHKKLDGAIESLTEVYELAHSHLDPNDELALDIQSRYGTYLFTGPDSEEGERLMRDAWQRERQRDPFSKRTHDKVSLLAVRIAKKGRAREAEDMIRAALEEYEQEHGTTRGIANLHHRLGNVLLGQRRFEEAEIHLQQAFTWDRTEKDTKPGWFVLQHNLGFCQWQLGKLEAAERNLRAALIQRTKSNGYNVLNCGNLALVLAEQGKFEQAIELARTGVDHLIEKGKRDHWRMVRMRRQFAEVLMLASEYALVEEQLKEIERIESTSEFPAQRRDWSLPDRFAALYEAWERTASE